MLGAGSSFQLILLLNPAEIFQFWYNIQLNTAVSLPALEETDLIGSEKVCDFIKAKFPKYVLVLVCQNLRQRVEQDGMRRQETSQIVE